MSKKKVVYLSLPISGWKIETVKAREEELKAFIHTILPDWTIITPFDLNRVDGVPDEGKDAPSTGWYMGRDIQFIIDSADAVFMAEGWQLSQGCKVERYTAEVYNKRLYFESSHRVHPRTVEELLAMKDGK